MNYTIIVLGVVVIILLYILYKYFSTSATTLSPLAKLSASNPALPMPANSTSLNYAYGVWVSVNSWSTGYKTIFSRNGGTTGVAASVGLPTGLATGSPQIILYLDNSQPYLWCYIDQQSQTDAIGPIQLTQNFPLQTWVYVTISVQGQYVDLYLQGKLVKSIQLKATPTQPGDSTKPVNLGTGCDASIAKFQYYPHSLSPQDVWANYMSGNGQNSAASTFSSYGVNIDLLANGIPQSTFKLF
jgi:hypothetical protein